MGEKIQIVYKKIDELIPYINNPRVNDTAVDYVAASIKEFGFKNPIIIDKTNTIICGHTRLLSAQKLKIEEVPCIYADDLSEQQIKAFRLADNKTAEFATWDLEKLEIELESIGDLEMVEFGFEPLKGITEEEEYEQKKREFEERMAAGELSEDSEEYQEFLQKFEPKKTTDDCYTPEPVYEAVANFVEEEYGIKKADFVRPFIPGGDYERFNYPDGCAVVDNPPFSILSEILTFYKERNIKFFLFAPMVSLFSGAASSKATALCVGVGITYENGAIVNTSFLTNLEDPDIQFKTAPKLYEAVENANKENLDKIRKRLPKYSYPLSLITAVMLTPYSRYGIEFEVKRSQCFKVSELDAQKGTGKAIFGGGYLISETKKAEREKAEREKAEREKAERWELSDRERAIIMRLNEQGRKATT